MTTPSRRERLEAMLAENPTDTFLRYGLAMELQKEDRNDECLQRLDELARDDAPYVPAYFMAGQLLVRLHRVDEARAYLRNGIEEARRQGNLHAAGEMSELLASLGALGEF